MATLADIRAKLKEQEARSTGSTRSGGDNAIYPFWNLKESEQATVRFLPDGDKENTFFWKERLMIKLPFAGIKGDTDSRPVQVQVPCMEMYGETCQILTEVRAWFKDPKLEDMGRKYWKKRSYIFQGFVKEDPLNEEESPANPVRRFIIGPQIFQIIKGALMDPDMEDLPTDNLNGVDFRIIKTSKGGYADYSTSTWSRKSRALTDEENNAVSQFNLFNLSDFLPKKPSDVEVKVMQEMFQASVDGEPYDQEKFGQYFRPAGLSAKTGDPVTPKAETPAPAAQPVATEAPKVETPAEKPATQDTNNSADDILAMIRARQGK